MDFSLLESVPDAMVIVDAQGIMLYVNGIAEKLFGYDRAELVGQPVEILLPARFRQMHQIHRGGYSAAPRTRPMGLGLDLFGLTRDGAEFPAEISLAPMQVEGSEYTIGAIRDATERKKIESRAQLYRKAAQEVRERDEFLSVASHELRTPVTALQLQLQMLHRAADRSLATLPAVLSEKVESLERQTKRISTLVNELLDVSRMRLGKLQLKIEELDLAAIARESVAHLRAEVERTGSTLELVADSPVIGRWDRMRLEQVIGNLIVNASKFGKGNPITVEVAGEAHQARLSVTDRGIGIAPEHQGRVFQRFERAVPSENFGGLGLGLFIVREIVEAHGGTVSLVSTPGSGSTFTVELPLTPKLQPAPADAPAPGAAQAS